MTSMQPGGGSRPRRPINKNGMKNKMMLMMKILRRRSSTRLKRLETWRHN